MQHEGGPIRPAPSRVIASWPRGSFAENIAVDRDGTLAVTLHTDRAVVRVDPRSGAVTPLASFPEPVAGLAFHADGTLIVSGGTPGQLGGVMWRVAPDGTVATLADIPEAAFLNGVTPLPDGAAMLVAESLGGRVYRVDLADGTVEPWLVDARLQPSAGTGSPGVNGLKVFGDALTLSVTADDRLYRANLAGGRPGPLTLVAERLRADDIAFGADGSLFIATHPAHSLVRLAPDGVRTTLATAEHGLTGATAVAFGCGTEDSTAVYVTTTGGTMTLPPDAVQPAKLVRVDVGVAGAAIPGGLRHPPAHRR